MMSNHFHLLVELAGWKGHQVARKFYGYSYTSISRQLGISPESARVQVSRLLSKLKPIAHKSKLERMRKDAGRDWNDSEQLSAREEKKALVEVAKILSSRYPIPERKGCPGSQALNDVAYQRLLPNLNEVLDHTLRCSPCFVESQRYVRQYQRRRLLFRTVLPIAASILIVAVTYFYWVSREETKMPTHPQQTPPEIVSRPPTTDQPAVPQIPAVHAATIVLQSPIRGTNPQTSPKRYTLPRGLVDLTLQMPVGYQDGLFEVQISGKKSKIEHRVNPQLKEGLLRIESRIDLSGFEPGPCQLTVTKIGESAKYAALLRID